MLGRGEWRRVGACAAWLLVAGVPVAGQPAGVAERTTPAELYQWGCAACHGTDGKGAPASQVGFDIALPDFTDCAFASREPDGDWLAVVHAGGPVRGFDRMMPAFGDAWSEAEMQRSLDHVRTFCRNDAWPRGELNLPRALVTEKAYPEDEAVLTTGIDLEGDSAVTNELIYEKRFGPRSQIEVAFPIDAVSSAGSWAGGVGDIGLGFKHAVAHSLSAGSILSVGGEVILPTGDVDRDLGKGTAVVEPYVSFGQILPADSFLHLQGGVELSTDTAKAEHEGFWRGAFGKTFTRGAFGRAWSPMLEVLGKRELSGGAPVEWDLLPQVQVTLNRRQHVMANVGVRVPVTRREHRDTQLVVYLLWDWFDGGFGEGW